MHYEKLVSDADMLLEKVSQKKKKKKKKGGEREIYHGILE